MLDRSEIPLYANGSVSRHAEGLVISRRAGARKGCDPSFILNPCNHLLRTHTGVFKLVIRLVTVDTSSTSSGVNAYVQLTPTTAVKD